MTDSRELIYLRRQMQIAERELDRIANDVRNRQNFYQRPRDLIHALLHYQFAGRVFERYPNDSETQVSAFRINQTFQAIFRHKNCFYWPQ